MRVPVFSACDNVGVVGDRASRCLNGYTQGRTTGVHGLSETNPRGVDFLFEVDLLKLSCVNTYFKHDDGARGHFPPWATRVICPDRASFYHNLLERWREIDLLFVHAVDVPLVQHLTTIEIDSDHRSKLLKRGTTALPHCDITLKRGKAGKMVKTTLILGTGRHSGALLLRRRSSLLKLFVVALLTLLDRIPIFLTSRSYPALLFRRSTSCSPVPTRSSRGTRSHTITPSGRSTRTLLPGSGVKSSSAPPKAVRA
ncbi:unnamed protein product [Amoebophrya sp. A120]|nr:unnamed protein product [Amoebophrya sp. A120]|eukprot:GSA120T00000191001.1